MCSPVGAEVLYPSIDFGRPFISLYRLVALARFHAASSSDCSCSAAAECPTDGNILHCHSTKNCAFSCWIEPIGLQYGGLHGPWCGVFHKSAGRMPPLLTALEICESCCKRSNFYPNRVKKTKTKTSMIQKTTYEVQPLASITLNVTYSWLPHMLLWTKNSACRRIL